MSSLGCFLIGFTVSVVGVGIAALFWASGTKEVRWRVVKKVTSDQYGFITIWWVVQHRGRITGAWWVAQAFRSEVAAKTYVSSVANPEIFYPKDNP